jgi:adenylate kinase
VELSTHHIVMNLVTQMKAFQQDHKNMNKLQKKQQQELMKKMSKEERKIYQKQLADQKILLINELTNYIPSYGEAVLSYLRAYQAVAIQVEAALVAAREVKFHMKNNNQAITSNNNNNHNNNNNNQVGLTFRLTVSNFIE